MSRIFQKNKDYVIMGMNNKMQIERKKVSSLVLEKLIDMVKTGELAPNTQLPSETELARKFGVSRAPLREALSVLNTCGVIESRQGGRSWVKETSLANLLEPIQLELTDIYQMYDLLEMRTIIEGEAAFLAASRRTKDDVDDLQTSLEAFERVTAVGEIGYEVDFAFHRVLVKAAANPFLTATMNDISNLHLKALNYSLSKNLGWEAKQKDVFLEHVAIYQAIRDGNGAAAKQAVITHLTNARIKLGDPRVSNT